MTTTINVYLLIALIALALVLAALNVIQFTAIMLIRAEGALFSENDDLDDPADVVFLPTKTAERWRTRDTRPVYPDHDCTCQACRIARSTQNN